MRQLMFASIILLAGLVKVGCVIPFYSPEPDTRARQLIFISEGLRHIPEIWERIWALEMPDVATPYRTHGGVI